MDNAMTTVSRSTHGWINGFIGVLIFSGSLPATKAGITGFAPDFLTTARAALPALPLCSFWPFCASVCQLRSICCR